MEILHIQTSLTTWEIFRSDRPQKIGTIKLNQNGEHRNFTAQEYPYTNGNNSWLQWGSSLQEVQQRVLENWPKFCKIADKYEQRYQYAGQINHGNHT